MKRVLLILLSLMVAAAAYTAVVRTASAQECGPTDGVMIFDAAGPSSAVAEVIWNQAPAPPLNLTRTAAKNQVQLNGLVAECGNAIPGWGIALVSWAVYVGVALSIATVMSLTCFPECEPAVPSVAGSIAGAVSSYIETGLADGDWGLAALGQALKSAMQNFATGLLIAGFWPRLYTDVAGWFTSLPGKMVGSGWFNWILGTWWQAVAQQGGPIVREIEMAVAAAGGAPA